jgi:hypothetical protein
MTAVQGIKIFIVATLILWYFVTLIQYLHRTKREYIGRYMEHVKPD